MSLTSFFIDHKEKDHRSTLLQRFHVAVIIVNLLAIGVDLFTERYQNAVIELSVVVLLSLNLWQLKSRGNLKQAAYAFLAVISIALFALVYTNHFATMSVVFVLLLPLTTLLFIRLKYSLVITILFFTVMAFLLYIEHLNNPNNPIVHNPKALFNLAYAAIIIYLFGLLYHFSILRTFEELDASNRQKELLLSEVHHRVKNNLNVIASIIGLQANTQGGSEKEQLMKSKTRIESIAIVHEMLYKYEDFDHIDFYSYMRRLSDLLLGMYTQNQNIHVEISADEVKLPLNVMVQLGIMANELLTNSIKYAFEDGSGTILMEIARDGDRYTFVYSDNGRGVEEPERLLESKSLGIKLIHLAAKQLNGSVVITNAEGLQYQVEFEDA